MTDKPVNPSVDNSGARGSALTLPDQFDPSNLRLKERFDKCREGTQLIGWEVEPNWNEGNTEEAE